VGKDSRGNRLSASDLRELLRAATLRLEQRASAIDRLNVFPVPDADTGSNMAYGMRYGLGEADREPAAEACRVAEAFARGALAGARGNSGLILSQFWRGLAEAARGAPTLGVEDLARGLATGRDLAFKAVAIPVPGTILTVMTDVAQAAQKADGALPSFLGRLVEAARASVARTPLLLAVLRRSGVVDAGAEGLYRILEGAWRWARERAGEPWEEPAGETADGEEPAETLSPMALPVAGGGGTTYGTCTEFFLRARGLDPDAVRAALRDLGDSLIVTPGEGAVRVHLHTGSPQEVLARAASLGSLGQVSLRDMDAQHRELGRGAGGSGTGQAVIARVPGRGLAEVFRSLGAAEAAVRGDPQEEARLLAALRSIPAKDLLLIPNLPDAEVDGAGLRAHTPNRLHVLAARTVPQGVAAIVAFDPGAELAVNLRRMGEAMAAVVSLEIREEEGRVAGLIEGRRQAEGKGLGEVLERLLPRALAPEGRRNPPERLTLFYAAGLEGPEAERIGGRLRAAHPGLQVEILAGGQPGRGLIVSVE
jgi:DAK2 domain fusion protein YloV